MHQRFCSNRAEFPHCVTSKTSSSATDLSSVVLLNPSFKTTLKAQLKQSQKRNGASSHLKEDTTGRGMFVAVPVVLVVVGGGGGGGKGLLNTAQSR